MSPVRVVAPTSVKLSSFMRSVRGGRALAHHEIDVEIFHRRIEHFFDRPRQPVDLVDEQHVAVLQVGEDRREVTRPFERGARRDVQFGADLVGDDVRQRRLAQPGRAGEEHVVGRMAPLARRAEDDRQASFEIGLADELGQRARPQADAIVGFVDHFGIAGVRIEQLVRPASDVERLVAFVGSSRSSRHTRTAMSCNAWRTSTAGSPTGGRSASTRRISSCV